MSDPDNLSPLSETEIAELRAIADRARFQRGAQGLWARRWLRLLATIEAPAAAKEGA